MIVRQRQREQAQEPQLRKGVLLEDLQRLGTDAPPPAAFAEPVADLRRVAFDVGARNVAQAAGSFAANIDGKIRLRVFLAREGEERLGIVDGLGMRKPIAQMLRHVHVVGVMGNGRCIRRPPPAQRAALTTQDHFP